MMSELFDQVNVLNVYGSVVWQEALRVSGMGMGGVFFVMGLFAMMIVALTTCFPDNEGQ